MSEHHSSRAHQWGEAGYQLLAHGIPLLLLLATGSALWQLFTQLQTPLQQPEAMPLELWVSPPLLLLAAVALWLQRKAAPLLLGAFVLLTLLPLWVISGTPPTGWPLLHCAAAGLGLLLSLLHYQRHLLR